MTETSKVRRPVDLRAGSFERMRRRLRLRDKHSVRRTLHASRHHQR